jgi:2-polyprenyl-6-methoxyphenol hydroxylase-like FAD-dependent oxidoreductase
VSKFDVCIVGAGPVGLTLALDLGKRGINTALVEKELKPGPWPKMERCNARSMEIYRRLGVHDEIRRRGQPEDASMNFAIRRLPSWSTRPSPRCARGFRRQMTARSRVNPIR